MLNCHRKSVFTTEYTDVERFIDKEFGVGFDDTYELPCMEEKGNDVYMDFDVDGELSEYELKEIEEMQQLKKYKQWNTRNILNYLCFQDKLEPGEYVVHISW
jgi:hypothetical protein